MINVSEETKQAIQDGTRTFNGLLNITLADGTELDPVTNTELMSYSVDDAVSDDNKFTALGGVVINQITFSLNNIDGDYSDYDFFDAEVEAYLTIGVPDENPTVIRKGVYHVDDAVYTDKEIILTCLDNMAKFDKPYSVSELVYPATLSEIILDLCDADVCGVVLNTYDFPHKSYTISARPGDEATTCREVLSYVAQIAGCFARCDNYGRLELKWFDTNALSTAMGDLTEQEEYVHYISSCYSCSVSTDDVVITGVEIAVEQKDADDNDVTVVYSSGTKGYVIRIEKNALITSTNAQEIANWLGVQLIGASFRKASITHTGDPTIEAGDVAVLTDRKSNSYAILITHTVFGIGVRQKTDCGAETPSKNSATRFKETTKDYVELRKKITKEKENRELALETLAERLDSKSAMYTTKEENASHQVIAWYLHDQPTLADSEYVWKMTTEAWGVSTDGGETWNGGMTVDGDTIVRILTATGISASWINTGELVVTNNGTEILYANVETGVVRISGNAISITSGDYLDNAINNTSKTVTRTILDNAQAYGLGLRVNKSGFSTDANGTCYYHGYSSLGNASNADGWVQWNGNRVTIPKGRHINPGSTMPFGVTVYNVYRTSDTSWHDVVWIESSNTWEANTYSGSTPSSRAAWTWNEATDIVLASYSIASSGAAITDAKLFTPPKKYSELAEVASMKAKLYTDTTLSDFATTINAEIDDIQAQLDGVVDTYYYAYTPTTSNVPASAWTTQALKEEHEGDLFLDTSTGKSYRWVYESNTWQWKEIPDTASAQALMAAQNAQDTADHKRRVFLAEPTPPYDAGDLWMQGASGDILACINARSSGSYVSTDWSKLNKYTDDTATTALATRVTTLETETVAYYMEVSQAAVVKGTDGTYSPSTITVSATAQKISEALAAYAGWFKIETKTGSTWTSRYTTTGTAESSYTYTIPANTDAIRCSLYKESGLTTLLDQQTVPVVSDAKRGSGIYKVTTAPSSYTTETGGFTPTYRISLSTVLTQAGVSEVLVGDVLEYSYYHYPVGYVDSNYVYLGARTSIRGSQGAAGTNGTNGTNGTDGLNANIWTATADAVSPNYTFSISDLTGSADTPRVGDIILRSYYRYTITSVGETTVLAGNRTSIRGAQGATGTAGTNNAVVTLYKRGSSAPSKPTTDLTYTFATGVLSGTLSDWSQTIPSGTDPVWAIVATASSNTATDTISSSEWSAQTKILENGVNGTSGTDGYNQATIYLYQRAASAPSKPSSAVTYTFSTGALSSTPSGWSRSIPAYDGNPCYVTTAAAISQNSTYSIASTAWSDVVKLAEDGENGDDGADAYTVLLTNESHTFAGDETAALNATATSKVITYKGATQISCYAGSSSSATSISTGITGLTCTITSNNSQDVTLTFTASPDASHKLTTKSGTVTIPVHADGKTFNLIFSFSISLKGEDGADGEDAYYLETPFTWTNNGTIAEFEAIIYKGEEDVTSDYTNASFEWYLRNENGENRIAIGKTCSVAKSNLGYGSTITCVFTTYDNQNAQLLTRSGAGLQTRSGLRLTTFIQADGDQPITMLPYKTAYEVIHNDYLLGIDAADGYRVSVENFTENIVNSAFDTENLLTYPYTDTTTIVNDVTYVDNEDGSLEITGTASANAVFYLKSSAENFMLDPGVYHITQPNNASGSTIRVGIDGYKLGVYVKSYVSGASNRITILDTDDIDALVIWVIVYNGYTVSNYEFTPEIFSEVPTVSVRQALGDRIYRYGDTMEGGALQLRSYNTGDTIPQTTQGGQCYISFINNVRHQSGWLQSKMTADGYCTIDLYARYPNTTKYAYLRMGTTEDGTQWVGVSSAAAWRTALGVVNKAGDTMTGNLHISKTYDSIVFYHATSVNSRINATAPDANRRIGSIQHLDGNDASNVVFYSETFYTTDRQLYTSFVTRRYSADGSSYINHGFYQRINNDGSVVTNFTNAASRDAWATGLNVVKKAGDLMTGSLSMHNSDITIGTTPSSNYYGKAVVFEDSAGTDFGVVRGNYYSSGILGIQMLCQRTISGASRTNVLTLNVDTSGNATVGITGTNAAANWRSAIGAAASGSSSIRYKHDIKDMTDEELDAHRLYGLKPRQFVFNDDFDHLQYEDMKGQTLPGFIAEEVDEVYPSATIRKDGQIENWDERRLIPAMLKLIQEQHEEIKKLKQIVHVA